jgi:hypothetical protein
MDHFKILKQAIQNLVRACKMARLNTGIKMDLIHILILDFWYLTYIKPCPYKIYLKAGVT